LSRLTIWAPWRIEYIRGPKGEGCIFCGALGGDADRDNLVLTRGEGVFVILNRFPYTAGHMMVVPNRHVADPEDLELGEVTEIWSLFVRAKAALGQVFRPHGYNVGVNLGVAAGAGVADHLHLHVVPRWAGDTNFMPAVGEVTVISQHLTDMYDSLAPCFGSPAGTQRE
jgi:ATP adenylyltransferase